jgi:hypothetical protein
MGVIGDEDTEESEQVDAEEGKESAGEAGDVSSESYVMTGMECVG